MQGYLNNPEETDQAIRRGRATSTGRIGQLSMHCLGRITITDRLKNIIVLGNGRNVLPDLWRL